MSEQPPIAVLFPGRPVSTSDALVLTGFTCHHQPEEARPLSGGTEVCVWWDQARVGTSGRHCRSWRHWHLVEGCRETLQKKWGQCGHCFAVQPGLTRLEAPASGAAETHLGSALRFFLP